MLEGEFISLIKGNFIINCCLHMHACIQHYIKHLSKDHPFLVNAKGEQNIGCSTLVIKSTP